MEHPNWQWNPLAICQMGSFPFETGSSCCGITQIREQCKNVIKQATLKSGRQKLDVLAEEPLTTANLKFQLQEIARDFLCTRWHRERQSNSMAQKWYEAAIRYLPQTGVSPRNPSARYPRWRSRASGSTAEDYQRSAPTVENSLNSPERPTDDHVTETDSAGEISSSNDDDESSETPACRITPSILQKGQIPWDVSLTRPAILEIVGHDAELRVITLKSFTRNRDREQCYICHAANDGSENDDPVTLHCGRCELRVHSTCMQLWLGSLQSAQPTICPQCKYDGAFDARFEEGTGGSMQIIETGSWSENESNGQIRRSERLSGSRNQAREGSLRRSARIAARSGNGSTRY